MYLSESAQEKWAPILEHADAPAIQDPYKKAVTAVLLENQEKAIREQHQANGLFEAAPLNGTSNVAGFDPVLISLVRRSMPQLIAYDVAGVQPMTAPTGLIFAMRAKDGAGNEVFYNEADTDFAGAGTHAGTNPMDVTPNSDTDSAGADGTYTTGTGMTTGAGEALGSGGGGTFNEMQFSVEKISVEAKTRALKAEYTVELAQDLKAVHGLDAETELANILSGEILAEINREVMRTIYRSAKLGATNGVFDVANDSDGRYHIERFKGLMFQIEREANAIAKETRRGKGNFIIVSSDVASALAAAGIMEYNPSLNTNLQVDSTGNTFAGVLNGRTRVYVDPYAGNDFVVVGYKGDSAYDAGIFYCPYVPLQMVRAVGENTFQPKIGFKTRYGMVANPFAQGTTAGAGALTARVNTYYRGFSVTNLL
jgi:hypothetical protein